MGYQLKKLFTKQELEWAGKIKTSLKTRRSATELLNMRWSDFIRLCADKKLKPVFTKNRSKTKNRKTN